MAKRAEGAEYVAAMKARVWESAAEAEPEAMAAGEPVVVGGGGCSNGNGVAEIDEDLHSRQLAVYGRETTRLLFASNVLVSGLNGLGAETAKNLALTGAKSVTLHDVENLEMWDLSGNFFLSEDDIRKKGVVACVAKLQELNNAIIITSLTEELSNEHLSKFQAVVFTSLTLEKSVEFDDYCSIQQPPISFIKAEVCGLFGSVFCDFGPEFTVIVVDGEDPQTGIIAYISNGNPVMVFCIDDERLEFKDGDLVAAEYAAAMRKAGDAQARELLERVRECLEKERCNKFEDCLAWARLKFEDYFSNHVKQLIFIFPEDTASSTGAPFWSAPKRFPHPVQFSAVDSSKIQFILAASILRAVSFGIPIPDWAKNMSDLVNAVSKVAVPEFEPKGGVKIETDEKATNLTSASVDDVGGRG